MTSPSNPDTRSDEAVFEAYRDGDAEGLGTLVRRYHDDLLRFLVRLVGDRAGAEDVFQETFLQIHLSADSFDASRRFKPWLFTIAANKARDHLRRTSRRRMLNLSAPLSSGSGGGTPDDGTTFVDLLEVEVPKPGDAADT
ncbi:MAG: sigma-70 family RNA polymerase sigma factor, partial [Phycisphaerae bacterium]|nr:sigma-70 family RNA polymerase sigma factor [Phycisphaerae bacterium]